MLEQTVTGLGYDFAGWERPSRGLLRIFIDKADGIGVEDCARVSNHLTRMLPVEGVAYDRLEVSSPGLDRLLRTTRDFARYAGATIRVKLRVPQSGRRNFVGRLGPVEEKSVKMDVDGATVEFAFDNIEKARLVPSL